MSTQGPDSIGPIWFDPTRFDAMKHGPPYLPETTSTAKLSRDQRMEVVGMVRNASVASNINDLYERLMADYEGLPGAELAVLLSYLRGSAIIHQANHWQTNGATYYGDHLLFERIYGDIQGQIDSLAERSIGIGSARLVEPFSQARQIMDVVAYLKSGVQELTPDQRAMLSLHTEVQFLALFVLAYTSLENKDVLSGGTDDLLQGIASKHEEFVYLLKQRSTARTASTSSVGSDAWKATR